MAIPIAPLLPTVLSLAALSPLELSRSFNADAAAWAGSDVIVVSEGDEIDGHVTVLETWIGHIAPGTELTFGALAHYQTEVSRKVEPSFLRGTEGESLKHVTGSRLVLFLVRGADGALRLTDTLHEDALESIAWIEDGRIFARTQVMNPGNNGIRPVGTTGIDLRARVEGIFALKDGLNRMEAFSDPLVRVMAVAPHCHDPRPFVQERAFGIVAASGEAGTAHLRTMALDHRTDGLERAPQALRALSTTTTEILVPILGEVLTGELEYWTAVELPESWWSIPEPTPKARRSRHGHYGRLLATLRSLDSLSGSETAPALDAVLAIKALWETRPELAALSNSQLPTLCASILGDS